MSFTSKCAFGLAAALATTSLATATGTGATGLERAAPAAAVEPAVVAVSSAVEPVVEAPEQVTAGRLVGHPVEVALGPDGHAVGVWSELAGAPEDGQSRLVASHRTADGTWTEPEEVREPANYHRTGVSLATVGSDGAVLVWGEWNDDSGTGRVYRSELADSTWTEPELVGTGVYPTVVGNGSVLVMTWSDGGLVKVTTRSVDGGGWSPVRSYPGMQNVSPAAGPRGAAAVVWGQYAASGPRLRVLYRDNDADGWDRPVSVPVRLPRPLTYQIDSFAVTVDGSGRVVVAWLWRSDVYWTRRTRSGAWSTIAAVPGEVGRRDEDGGIWSDGGSRGRVLLVWYHSGSFAARYRPRSGFARAQLLSPPPSPTTMFQAAFDPPLLTGDGVAVVLGESYGHLAWRWQPPGQPWSSIRTIDKFAGGPPPVAARGRVIATLAAAETGLIFRQVRVPVR